MIAAVAATILMAVPAMLADDVQREFRTFTNSAGKEIQAVLVDKNDTEVKLLLKGRAVPSRVPIADLSEADQEYVKNWNRGIAIFLDKCRALTVRELLELRGYESIPFYLENNSIHVKGELNGKPAKFLIDTGAGTTVLHLASAEAAGCKIGPMDQKIYGIAGEAPAAWTEIPTLTLGLSVVRDQRFLSSDLMKDLPKGAKRRQDAIFGADLLHLLDAVISYKERRIFLRPDLSDDTEIEEVDIHAEDDGASLTFRIFKLRDKSTLRGKVLRKTPTAVTLQLVGGKERTITIDRLVPADAKFVLNWSQAAEEFLQHCRGLSVEELLNLRKYQSFVYERRGNHIFVDGTLNDHQVTYMIDTGADSSVLHDFAAKKYDCEVGPYSEKVYGIGGFAPAAPTMVKKITLGDAVVTNRRLLAVDLARFQADDALGYAGIYGADFMREMEAVITYRESRVFLKPDRAAKRPAE
ncbi:MAG: clan AA aspartic protease [Akkermansiaceae bacterium]|nr:clan AA aspartic protease [Akkermansiaceae bacterium]